MNMYKCAYAPYGVCCAAPNGQRKQQHSLPPSMLHKAATAKKGFTRRKQQQKQTTTTNNGQQQHFLLPSMLPKAAAVEVTDNSVRHAAPVPQKMEAHCRTTEASQSRTRAPSHTRRAAAVRPACGTCSTTGRPTVGPQSHHNHAHVLLVTRAGQQWCGRHAAPVPQRRPSG